MPTDFAALLRAEKGQQQDATRQPAPQTDWAALLSASARTAPPEHGGRIGHTFVGVPAG